MIEDAERFLDDMVVEQHDLDEVTYKILIDEY